MESVLVSFPPSFRAARHEGGGFLGSFAGHLFPISPCFQMYPPLHASLPSGIFIHRSL